jgi:hypothetical protein
MTTIAYNSPRQTCYAVQRAIERQFPNLVARPWNVYEPETSLWWLVPSGDWPAYKYGKMFFDWADPQRKQIWVGFHSEKGLDDSISSVYKSAKGSRLIMHDDWHWFDMFRRLADGQFANVVKNISPQLSVPLQFRVLGGYVEDPTDFDPYASLLKRDEYLLQWNPNSSRFDAVLSKPEGHVLGELDQIITFEQFAQQLKLLTSNAWVWIDFNFVVPFEIQQPDATDGGDVWRASELWSNFLRHFRQFWF